MRAFDNSTLDDFRLCMRYGYYRHVRGWQYPEASPPLLFGHCWHAAMDVVWTRLCGRTAEPTAVVGQAHEAFMEEWKAGGGPDPIPVTHMKRWQPRLPAVAKLMLEGYVAKRAKALSKLTLVRAEEPFAVPLGDDLVYTGRRDKIVQDEKGKIIVVEHKTTTYGGKDGFRPVWKDSWSPKSQIDGYLYSVGVDYPKVNASLWIDAALVHMEHRAFDFIAISRQAAHLDGWLWGVRYFAAMVRQHWDAVRPADGSKPLAKEPYLPAFPQNTQSCTQYGRACTYLDVCKMRPNPEQMEAPPPGMVEKFWSPLSAAELEELTR